MAYVRDVMDLHEVGDQPAVSPEDLEYLRRGPLHPLTGGPGPGVRPCQEVSGEKVGQLVWRDGRGQRKQIMRETRRDGVRRGCRIGMGRVQVGTVTSDVWRARGRRI